MLVSRASVRTLFAHPNSVRHRLWRVSELTGFTAAVPRDALALRLAPTLDRLGGPDAR